MKEANRLYRLKTPLVRPLRSKHALLEASQQTKPNKEKVSRITATTKRAMAEDIKAEIKSLESAMQACDKDMDIAKSNGNAEAAAKHALRNVDLTSALNEKRRNLTVLCWRNQ